VKDNVLEHMGMDVTQVIWQLKRQLATVLLVITVFAAGFVIGNLQSLTQAQQTNQNTEPPASAEEDFAAFWETYNLIQKIYIDKVDSDVLVDGAIKGMVDALGDQNSGYITPEFFGLWNDFSGQIEGIGVVISQVEGTGEIEVVNVLKGTPAERAGLREKDVFVTVNGEEVTGFTYLDLASRVRGPAGTFVNLEMRRGDEILSFSIERARIQIPNVETRVIDGTIGYLSLDQFRANSRSQIDEALREINAQNMKGLIIDFRGNPGGLLSSGVDIASLLLPANTVVLNEEFGDGTTQTFQSNGNNIKLNIPVVLLVNEGSASASELVAAAWQDNGVATLIGAKTFGKGTVQQQHDLINGGGVRLTIARWVRPEGTWIHGIGVTPDITVEWSVEERVENPDVDPQLDAAIKFLNGQASN
jgi:carboxyl-terminal processing protease